MNVTLTDLPLTIQQKIPLSLRTFKDTYNFDELPGPVQILIRPYLIDSFTVSYVSAFDIKQNISEYGDFTVIDNLTDLVTEYLKNYFLIRPEDYPFDPIFGSRIKEYLHTKDTAFRRTLITNEVNNIIAVIQADLATDIEINKVDITPVATAETHTEYNIEINVSINEQSKIIRLEIR